MTHFQIRRRHFSAILLLLALFGRLAALVFPRLQLFLLVVQRLFQFHPIERRIAGSAAAETFTDRRTVLIGRTPQTGVGRFRRRADRTLVDAVAMVFDVGLPTASFGCFGRIGRSAGARNSRHLIPAVAPTLVVVGRVVGFAPAFVFRRPLAARCASDELRIDRLQLEVGGVLDETSERYTVGQRNVTHRKELRESLVVTQDDEAFLLSKFETTRVACCADGHVQRSIFR